MAKKKDMAPVEAPAPAPVPPPSEAPPASTREPAEVTPLVSYCRTHGPVPAERAVVNAQGGRQCRVCMAMMSAKAPAAAAPTPTPSKGEERIIDERSNLSDFITEVWPDGKRMAGGVLRVIGNGHRGERQLHPGGKDDRAGA